MNRPQAEWIETDLIDMFGDDIKVGDYLIKSITGGRATNMEVCKCTRIENNKMYCDGSKVPIQYPCRMLRVTDHPKLKEFLDANN